MQIALLCGVALLLGWDAPSGVTPWLSALLLVVAGTAAFSSLGLLMAGTLRAEATLAAANLVYLLLLVSGGIAVPLRDFPAGLRPVLELLPSGALAEGLRDVLRDGSGLPGPAPAGAAGLGGGRLAARRPDLPVGVSRWAVLVLLLTR